MGHWRDQDELYGRLAAATTAAVAVPPPPAGGSAPPTGRAKDRQVATAPVSRSAPRAAASGNSSRSAEARQGPRQAATSSRSAGERQTDGRHPFFMALVPAASDCNGAARRPRQPAKHGLRAPPALAGTGSALAEARQGPRQAATSSRSVGERQTDERHPFFFAFVLVASGLRRAWGPRDPRQAPLAAGSHAIALGCAETTPRGPQPRRRDALPDYDLPRRRRGQRDGEPHVKWPSS